MKYLRIISILITGAVFVFSGIVKGIDPLGSAYKFHDYFNSFRLTFLQFLTLPMSFLLSLAEFLTGFGLLTGILRKEALRLAAILMIIFTPLTLYLAIANPVSDCGCFGDAIHLTNWQTFGKNLILVCLIIIPLTGERSVNSKKSSARQIIYATAAALVFLCFEFYNLIFLPVVDFLPYSAGTYIPGKMKIPEGAPVTQYETTFLYEKEGVRKEFTLKDYPANDSSWKFVEQKSKLIRKGYQPLIHDFSITTADNRDITDSVLTDRKPVFLMISKKLKEAGRKRLENGIITGNKLLSEGFDFYVLTSSGSDEMAGFGNTDQFCSADETTLKTMIRSNPGYMIIRDGVIRGKWSWANLPDNRKLIEKYR